MRRAGTVLLVLLALAVAASIAWLYLARSFPGAAGSMRTEQHALAPFGRVVVKGLTDVTLVQGATEGASITGSGRQIAGVRVDVAEGTLTIASSQTRRWWSAFFGRASRPARVTVTFRDIETIDTSGAVRLRADRIRLDRLALSGSGATSVRIADLDAKQLSVSGSGAMKVELAGRATEQTIDLSGAADYRAADLASKEARISVRGAGRVVVHAESTLEIGISGAGSVEYIGNPKVTQQVSGAGRIKRRDATLEPPLRQEIASRIDNPLSGRHAR